MVGEYLFDLEFDCYARHDEVRLHKPIDTSLSLLELHNSPEESLRLGINH